MVECPQHTVMREQIVFAAMTIQSIVDRGEKSTMLLIFGLLYLQSLSAILIVSNTDDNSLLRLTDRNFIYSHYSFPRCELKNIYISPHSELPLGQIILYIYLQAKYIKNKIYWGDRFKVNINISKKRIKFSDGHIINISDNSCSDDILSNLPTYCNFMSTDYIWRICRDKWLNDEPSQFEKTKNHVDIETGLKILFEQTKCIDENIEFIPTTCDILTICEQRLTFTFENNIDINKLCPIHIGNYPYSICPIISSVNEARIDILLIDNGYLEAPVVFDEYEHLNWNKLGMEGINHFYSYIDNLYDSHIVDYDSCRILAQLLGVNPSKQDILFKLHSIETK